MKNLLPYFIAIGISKSEFFDSTPKDLEPYVEAEKIRQKRRDAEAWQFSIYTMSAVSTAVAQCLSKHSKAKYMEEPLTVMYEKKQKAENLTASEKKSERKKLLSWLQLMQTNFELSHKKQDGG